MNDNGCIHLNNFKAAKGTNPYKIVHAFFVSCTSFEARRYKVSSLYDNNKGTMRVHYACYDLSDTQIIVAKFYWALSR